MMANLTDESYYFGVMGQSELPIFFRAGDLMTYLILVHVRPRHLLVHFPRCLQCVLAIAIHVLVGVELHGVVEPLREVRRRAVLARKQYLDLVR